VNKIRALVVDDEPIARERVLSLLQQEEDVEVVAECGDGPQAVSAIQHHTPDLIFLDVQMPGLDAFGVIQAIGAERMPTVIFITAYDEYALRAFEVHALDYLLKPFGRERFRETLKHARASLERRRAGDLGRRLLALVNDIKPEAPKLARHTPLCAHPPLPHRQHRAHQGTAALVQRRVRRRPAQWHPTAPEPRLSRQVAGAVG
jgi:DNA-binding LytR/AlgR family response regulator